MSTLVPITRSDRRDTLAAAAAQVVFALSGKGPVWAIEDIEVYKRIAPATAFTRIATGFTVALTGTNPPGSTGASVTFAVAPRPTVGDPAVDIQIVSRRVAERTTDVSRSGMISGRALDDALDRAATIHQEVRRDVDEANAKAASAVQAVFDAILGQIPDGSLTDQKLADMPAGFVKLRPAGASVGPPVNGSPAQLREVGALTPRAASRTVMKALDATKDTSALLMESGRQGLWRWDATEPFANAAWDTGEGMTAFPSPSVNGAWKRIKDGVLNVREFGVTGDGTTAEDGALAAAILFARKNGANVRVPAGKYRLTSGIQLNQSLNISPSTARGVDFFGDGSSNTVFIVDFNGLAINNYASHSDDSIFNPVRIGGFTMTQGANGGASSRGLLMDRLFGYIARDIVFSGLSFGMDAVDCVVTRHENLTFKGNKAGFRGRAYSNISSPNSMNFMNCWAWQNSEFAYDFQEPAAVSFFGGCIETTQGGVGGQRYGIKVYHAGRFGPVGLTMNGMFFEQNDNVADIWIEHGDYPAAYNVIGCNFSRNTDGGAQVAPNNILLATNGNLSSRASLNVIGCGFRHYGAYTPASSKKYIAFSGSTPIIFNDDGTEYMAQIERPTFAKGGLLAHARVVGATGTLTRGHNISQVVRTGTGTYVVTMIRSCTALTQRTYSLNMDIHGSARVVSESDNAVEIACVNMAGAATDPGALFVTVWE